MEIFTEQADTMAECLQKIRGKYGDRARVMTQKTIRRGGFLGLFTREGVEVTGFLSNEYTRAPAARKPVDFEEEKRKILAVASKTDPTLQIVLNEVRSLKEKIETGAAVQTEEHPSLKRLGELLALNDFTPAYTTGILDRLRKDFSLEALEDFNGVQEKTIEWIGESIRIFSEEKNPRRPRIFAIIGPTGVGKTTTIAKLAAIFGTEFTGHRPLEVRMITIDNYRIGAEHQIESYGEIMGIPVSSVKTPRELKQAIALNAEDVDLILIDTIGRSPRASIELGEMKQILDACGSSAEFHLALAATTKYSDIMEILRQFEPFGYRSVILTKLDETIRLGNVISALAERDKAVSYITEGQQVPNDIQRAGVLRFLMCLEGFTIDRNKYSSDESEQIQWRQ
ncbi:MAG: flagellar biosynthesis protein FlhF [Treponema sp.]|nr:flagellar biosynthesis protein FlhF [Treponema sp.]